MSVINWPLLAAIVAICLMGVGAYFGILPGWSNVW
jgi:hypothetical protein